MLEVSNDARSLQKCSQSQKVQNNLAKIRTLIQDALVQLKSPSRISTNQSDSSEGISPVFIHRLSIDLHKGQTQMMLESLEKGYVMMKHSTNAKPKEKYVYISSDRRCLCWKSLDKDDEKRIELRKINLVLRGKQEAGCYIQSKSAKKMEKMVILKSESRDLELESFNEEEAVKFEVEIKEAIKNGRSIHLSYRV